MRHISSCQTKECQGHENDHVYFTHFFIFNLIVVPSGCFCMKKRHKNNKNKLLNVTLTLVCEYFKAERELKRIFVKTVVFILFTLRETRSNLFVCQFGKDLFIFL